MIGRKVDFIRNAIEIPFLLENNVYFVEYPEQDYTETAFVNSLAKCEFCWISITPMPTPSIRK